ncbi:precorrin-3B C(17)-methyltransferase [Shimia sp. Alg240-R146]|uniref:precorrin-3B C(17)-methyltransferase n=1 Tax=Shimia sp. Alg240-R146 TaxID=2993449 RepID=UPI0022E53FE8|nr:precorrin-3B C(17)-methyltransferase [Shimia sp. Alg240-R146]
MSGWVQIVGIGPGDAALVTPQVQEALAQATDAVGYIPYVERVSDNPNLTLHPSDNRVELDRSRHALEMAADGRRVVVVSSGDPGIFAMAAAVYEAVEHGDPIWRDLDIRVLPGITAMLAASAACGAPLGHDFCAINLSDNMKPWELIDKRLRLAAEADFAMAFYNPRSKSRPEGFKKALKTLKESCGDNRPMIFARNVSRPDQTIKIVPLQDTSPDMADMRTVVLLGSSQTRIIARDGTPMVYTPRSVAK